MDALQQVSLIELNGIKNEAGELLDFSKYRFMYDIYNDRSPLLCCMKAAQIGFTTYEILKSAHECKNEGIDILYVLPTADDVKRFSGGKTNKILSQNPSMQEWTKDKDSIEQKQFGKNTIYYQGSWTERAALMITAKKLIVDEYDRCKQDIVEQYDSRLQSIANPKKAFFSNPSKPDFGVDLFYQKSDQMKWHITHSCGKEYVMDESCVDYKTEVYRCPSCKGEIIDEERRMGKWIATSQGEWRGYWIPLWIAPWMPAKKIAEAKRDKTPEFFANFVAGLPYLNTNDMLSLPMLERNLIPRVNDQTGRIIIGVDTGHNIHYVMGNKQGVFYHGYIKSVAENEASPVPEKNYDPYNELEDLFKRYPQAIMIADQGGDLIGIRKLQAKYKGRVFLCWFTKETKTQQIIRWAEGDEYGKVLVDRNRAIQIVVDEIKEQRFPLWGTKEDWGPYFAQWLNIYRTRDVQGEPEDPQYNWRWVWKRKGADHFALATIYMRVGLDRFAQDLAQIISKDDFMAGVPTADKPFRIPKQYQNVDL
jgi:ssDNA-binding Zn-finger/Zn-ribbon topoisomerase 1